MSRRSPRARLEFLDVRRHFPGTGIVIDGISLVVNGGEFVSVLGPSGCGKSTLLRLAAGLDRTDGGEVRVEGVQERLSRGFVFQDAHLLPWRTVLENVALPLELSGESREIARARAREVLERVGLIAALARYPVELSGGMKMRVSVARALVTRPRLLLLDEPFAALDENTRHRLQEDLRQLWRETPMTVLFVTHSVSEAAFLADRAIVLSGRPSRVLLDHPLRLPEDRGSTLRVDPAFLAELRLIRTAFETETLR